MIHPILDLPHEIINYVADYLSIKEKYTLKYLNKFLSDTISIKITDFDENFCKIFNYILGDNSIGKGLISITKESEGLVKIGGSSILQCIHDERYEGSDIDIYVDCCEIAKYYHNNDRNDDDDSDYDDYTRLQSVINIARNGKRCLSKNILDSFKFTKIYESLLKFLSLNNFSYSENDINDYIVPGASVTNFYHVNDFWKQNKIQIILLTQKYEDMPYDFTFCKNIYDGKNVYSKNIQNVINKKGKMNDLNILGKSSCDYRKDKKIKLQEIIFQRMMKYYDRGYKITNLYKRYDEMHHTLKSKYNKIFCMQRKKENILDLSNKLIKYIGKFLYFSERLNFKCSCKHINYVIPLSKKSLDVIICNVLNDMLHTNDGYILYKYIDDNTIKLNKNIVNYCINPNNGVPPYVSIDIQRSDLDFENIDKNKHLAAILMDKNIFKITQIIYSHTNYTISWKYSGICNKKINECRIYFVNNENKIMVELNLFM